MTTKTFTVEEFCQAAEKAIYPNDNDQYIEQQVGDMSFYDEYLDAIEYGERLGEKPKIISACVIGEAFLNLGMVPNGVTPKQLSDALREIKPDGGMVETVYGDYFDLSEFINTVNGFTGWKGKKRMAKNIRKYFSKSLDKKITLQVGD